MAHTRERGRRLLKRIFTEKDNALSAVLKEKLNYYMELNYRIELLKDEEKESGYTVSYSDLKGCTAHGEDLIDTVLNLEDTKYQWLITALQDGMEIPEPAPRPEEKHEKNK